MISYTILKKESSDKYILHLCDSAYATIMWCTEPALLINWSWVHVDGLSSKFPKTKELPGCNWKYRPAINTHAFDSIACKTFAASRSQTQVTVLNRIVIWLRGKMTSNMPLDKGICFSLPKEKNLFYYHPWIAFIPALHPLLVAPLVHVTWC